MKNIAQFLAQFHLLFETSQNENALLANFHPDVIVGAKVEITLPDGSVHTTSIAGINEMKLVDFENNSEEDEDK
ncbi:hypothetical protein EVU96_08895 [Bacillus infantis]|uniref:hypothetical protein n=1 Tax=Bacillus infantis TaxID=324767 RepID=UPI00101B74B5|nr:hypothetical protein [Bacillus infantis]RYI30521.1 hypothetical protein EVU96_08895 [Bacillus infantis]